MLWEMLAGREDARQWGIPCFLATPVLPGSALQHCAPQVPPHHLSSACGCCWHCCCGRWAVATVSWGTLAHPRASAAASPLLLPGRGVGSGIGVGAATSGLAGLRPRCQITQNLKIAPEEASEEAVRAGVVSPVLMVGFSLNFEFLGSNGLVNSNP